MKTNVMVYVDDRRKEKTGKCEVYIKVSRGRYERFLLNTGLVAKTKFTGREFPKTESSSSAKTSKLNKLFSQVEDYCIRNGEMSMADLKKALQGIVFGKVVNGKPFAEYCRRYAGNCSTRGTAGLYEQTARKVEAFDKNATFDTMNVGWLKEFASFPLNVLHIIGGGSLNKYLNQFTANSLGVDVLAGPQEGTAIGNIMLQAKAAGEVKDIWEMRQIIANSLDLKHYAPEDKEAWDKGYEKYLAITAQK